jgi:peptide subunit release factor 1 (eRF1)
VIEAVRAATTDEPVGRILVGGTPEPVAALRSLAPRPIAARIGGEISVDLHASADEVRLIARSASEALERESELRLVTDMFEKLGSGMASFGSEHVLSAINAQNVYILTCIGDLEISGAVCSVCGRLATTAAARPVDVCSRCAAPMVKVPDLVDAMLSRVLGLGGRTEEVRGQAADLLTPRGGIGVVHRYAAPMS